MHRFFCPDADFHNPQTAITDPKELHHLRDVLRLRKGDAVTVFNQRGEEAAGRITGVHLGKVTVAIESVRKGSSSGPAIMLACAIPKKGKFEVIIEKATELGVEEIIPLKTQRTEIDLKGERLAKKIGRYRQVAINAAKQSQRLSVPVIHPIVDFSDIKDVLAKNTIVLIPSLSGERKNIFQVLSKVSSPSRVAILIGPEGDFTPQEYGFAQAQGFIPVSLGPTVLKVETAAIAAVACTRLYYAGSGKSCL